MELPEGDRPPFKINEAVSTYDAVCMMLRAWNMALKTVVLNRWLSTSILAPHQMLEVKRIRDASRGTVERAFTPQVGASLSIKAIVAQQAAAAKSRGEEWLKSIEPLVGTSVIISTLVADAAQDNSWSDANIERLREDAADLENLNIMPGVRYGGFR